MATLSVRKSLHLILIYDMTFYQFFYLFLKAFLSSAISFLYTSLTMHCLVSKHH